MLKPFVVRHTQQQYTLTHTLKRICKAACQVTTTLETCKNGIPPCISSELRMDLTHVHVCSGFTLYRHI